MLTVWKFHNFSITQILREINFEESRSVNWPFGTHLEAQNSNFYELSHFLKLTKLSKFKAPKIANFRTFRSSKIDFT